MSKTTTAMLTRLAALDQGSLAQEIEHPEQLVLDRATKGELLPVSWTRR